MTTTNNPSTAVMSSIQKKTTTTLVSSNNNSSTSCNNKKKNELFNGTTKKKALLSLSDLKKVKVQSGRIKRSLVNCRQIRQVVLFNEERAMQGKAPQKKISLKNHVAGEKNKPHVISKYKRSQRRHFGLRSIDQCVETDDSRPTFPFDHPNKQKALDRLGSSTAKDLLQILLDSESSVPISDDDLIILFRKLVYFRYDLDSETLDGMDALGFIAKAQQELDNEKDDNLLSGQENIEVVVGNAISLGVGEVSNHVDTKVEPLNSKADKANSKLDKTDKKLDRLVFLLVTIVIILLLVVVFLLWQQSLDGGAQAEPEAESNLMGMINMVNDLYASTGSKLMEKIEGVYSRFVL